jgi:hypothetical protein
MIIVNIKTQCHKANIHLTKVKQLTNHTQAQNIMMCTILLKNIDQSMVMEIILIGLNGVLPGGRFRERVIFAGIKPRM